jgi:enoyl-[acyl-carrier protein] reductase I
VPTLSGKKGLIIGIANEHSLAFGCARHFHAGGAELAITYLNARAEPYVRKEDLSARITDCSAEGFALAMQVSVQSFMPMAKLSEPLMPSGGCLLAMSYYGAEKAIAHYNVMGPVKAALEAAVRYMAVELGQAGIRVNALSPGPGKTRAASGIDHFDELLERAVHEAPEHRLVTLDDVGAYAAFLVSDAARAITGNIAYVDAGYHIVA